MGSCLGANRSRDQQRYGSSSYPAMGKNQPLKKEHPKWKSDVPLTSGQLLSKREEFWDTAPVFEGQKEIWDALKAAASALESGDCSLAQAIIDGANIVLPHGTLLDCYDELGAHYQVPVYCLSHPVNLVQDGTVKRQQSFEEPKEITEDDQSALQVRIRLSTEKEVILKVLPSDAISAAKKRLEQQDEELPVSRQRWFFSGKMLTDPMRIEDCHLKKGFVILCIMREEPKESS